MGLPRNLVEVIAAIIELPHHRIEVRGRQFSGLNSVDELPQIDLPAQPAFLDGGIVKMLCCIKRLYSRGFVDKSPCLWYIILARFPFARSGGGGKASLSSL